VAKKANCSISTVSRALNNSGRINQETRAKILAIVEELNFQPNTAARNLAMNHSMTLGLVVSDITNIFYAEMADIIQKVALELGYCVVIVCDNDKPNLTKYYVDFLISRGVDGIIFGSARLHDPIISGLNERKFPIILLNRRMRADNVNCVTIDNVKGARLLTDHLLGLNYQNIAFISGPAQFSPSADRLEGYTQALAGRGIPINEHLIIQENSFRKEAGISAVQKLFQGPVRPQAIFAVNDTVALGALEAIQEMGLSVPEDVALAGFDDIAFSALRFVQLTTVSQRLDETASEAVKILVNAIHTKKDAIHKIVMEPILKIRRSSGSKTFI
jgi:DNA-binding LacI/PurR family transcriptional regulator